MSNHVKSHRKMVKQTQRSISESVLLLFPLFFTVIVLPLIVKMHTYNTGLSIFDWFSEDDSQVDFFLFYKQWIFVGISSIILIIIVARAFIDKKSLKFTKLLIPLGIYMVLCILSTLFSKYRIYGITGSFEQFENVFCLIGYTLVVYYAYLVIDTEAELKLMINAVAVGALLIGTIGTFQAFGLDYFNTTSGKTLISEPGVDISRLSIVFGKGRVYTTLYNPNYVGVYTSITIPLFSIMLFYSKKVYEFVLYGGVIATSIISLFGSQSRGGMLGIVIAIIYALFMLRKSLLKRWKLMMAFIVLFAGSFLVINFLSDNILINRLSDVFHVSKQPAPDLTGIDTTDNKLSITYKNNTMIIEAHEDGSFSYSDASGNVLNAFCADSNEEAYMMFIDDERFYDLLPIFTYEEPSSFMLCINDTYWKFNYNTKTGKLLYYNRYGRYCPINTAPSAVFDGYESFGSHRGYIWSRTLPLIKDYLFLGSGADSFICVFPQYDYVGFKNFGYADIMISKPHCLYLQISVQTGFLSLLAILCFFVWFILKGTKRLWSSEHNTVSEQILLAVTTAVISYLFSGLVNDSSISVAPFFFTLVGVGIAGIRLCTASNEIQK